MNQDTIELLKGLKPTQLAEDIQKSFSQATGLVFYDLEAAAKTLYPVLTPWRNRIPRVSGRGGTATNWKQITAINVTNLRAGVSEGRRGGVIADQVTDKVAAYKGLGLENSVTFEADYAARNFDDAKARAVQSLLNSVMIQEERVLAGGNNSLALGITPTPTVANAGTGGTIAAATYSVICVALTLAAWRESTLTGGVPTTANRTNADGTVDSIKGGHAGKSNSATTTTTGTTSVITASVTPVNGAVGYAWYVGAAGSERLAALTTINSAKFTSIPGASQLASALVAGDQSQDNLVPDGLLPQLWTPGSGAVNTVLATGTPGVGTALTSDAAGGIVEVDAQFELFWNQYRLSPDEMHVSARTLMAMNKLVISNGGAPLYRVNVGEGATIQAGVVIGSYLNKITNKLLKIMVHPELPDGMIVFWSNGVPYPLANVGNILQVKTRQEYYQIEWPLRTRSYEYGVYADELLQLYFPGAFGTLSNIAV